MTPTPAEALAHHEAADRNDYIAVGLALKAIRDGKLYKHTHTTATQYYRDRWKSWEVKRSISIAVLASTMKELGGPVPINAWHARALRGLTPEQAIEVMKATRERKPHHTADDLRDTRATLFPTPGSKPRTTLPPPRPNRVKPAQIIQNATTTMRGASLALDAITALPDPFPPGETKRLLSELAATAQSIKNIQRIIKEA